MANSTTHYCIERMLFVRCCADASVVQVQSMKVQATFCSTQSLNISARNTAVEFVTIDDLPQFAAAVMVVCNWSGC